MTASKETECSQGTPRAQSHVEPGPGRGGNEKASRFKARVSGQRYLGSKPPGARFHSTTLNHAYLYARAKKSIRLVGVVIHSNELVQSAPRTTAGKKP